MHWINYSLGNKDTLLLYIYLKPSIIMQRTYYVQAQVACFKDRHELGFSWGKKV